VALAAPSLSLWLAEAAIWHSPIAKLESLSQTAMAARACGVRASEQVFDIADANAIAGFPAIVQAQQLFIRHSGIPRQHLEKQVPDPELRSVLPPIMK